MEALKELLQELGISKVKLAKYLGDSREMVYNYLELDNINKWPKEKKILLFRLLDIDDGEDETIKAVKVTTDYMMEVESKLNKCLRGSSELDAFFDLKGLSKEEQTLLSDIAYLLKEKLTDSVDDIERQSNYHAFVYLYHLLQSLDNVPEIKYIFGYMSKTTGFTSPEEYVFDEDKQFIFEGILFSALTLYNNGGASRSRIIKTHQMFVQEIERKKEEALSRTQQLNTLRLQALKELNYTEINDQNAVEVLEKIAEIESRKV